MHVKSLIISTFSAQEFAVAFSFFSFVRLPPQCSISSSAIFKFTEMNGVGSMQKILMFSIPLGHITYALPPPSYIYGITMCCEMCGLLIIRKFEHIQGFAKIAALSKPWKQTFQIQRFSRTRMNISIKHVHRQRFKPHKSVLTCSSNRINW